MPDDPYRPPAGAADTGELSRLAAEGQRRIHAASDGRADVARSQANTHLRYAIGAVRGSRSSVLVPLIVLGVLAGLTGFALTLTFTSVEVGMPLLFSGALLGVGAYLIYVFLPPSASDAQLDAEHAWIAGLPFALERHFEVLSASPESFTVLTAELAWQGAGVDLPTLQGIVGLLDTDARVTLSQEGATITSGQISGSTGIAVDRVQICRNHTLARYVHRLVDVVLVPVHRTRALASVRLSRM